MNLYDFDPAVDAVNSAELEEADRYILSRYAELAQRIQQAYLAYDYATVFQGVNAFTTVDLSAFYNDISKDRLYTFAARSRERRSAQTAMYAMADGLTNAAIARKLFISEGTAKSHVKNILRKLRTGNRAEAISLYLKNRVR